jgi:hypothetical protein
MPRDPLLWVDLAREYSILGQTDPARRALRVAVALAPQNRFVLRSTSRFLLHVNEPSAAADLLVRSHLLRMDPWLLAAEIVSADISGRHPRFVRSGKQIVESGHFSDRDISELASALGTLELRAGRRRDVRKLLAKALVDPTENSVAQAGWIARHMDGFELPDTVLSVPRAFEAGAWEATLRGEYTEAIGLSWEWLRDEPFATRPALFGSWIASMAIGDYGEAAELVKAAAGANPGDPRLIAQLLYCRASDGQVEAAESLLEKLERTIRQGESGRSEAEWNVILSADRGLLAFRRGNHAEGRRFYEAALEIAVENRLAQFAASAYVNYVREEVLTNPGLQIPEDDLGRAAQAFPAATRGVVSKFIDRMRVLALASSGSGNPDLPSPRYSRRMLP